MHNYHVSFPCECWWLYHGRSFTGRGEIFEPQIQGQRRMTYKVFPEHAHYCGSQSCIFPGVATNYNRLYARGMVFSILREFYIYELLRRDRSRRKLFAGSDGIYSVLWSLETKAIF